MQNASGDNLTQYQLQVQIVWSTKYRYPVLQGEVQLHCREILRQVCDGLDVRILTGVIGKDHIHLHLNYPVKLSVNELVKWMKRHSERALVEEFGELRAKYWDGRLWSRGFGAWRTENMTDETIQQFLDHHSNSPNEEERFILK